MGKALKEKYAFMYEHLREREKNHGRRALRTVDPLSGMEVRVDGRRMINFCSNDYLGLSKHPMLKEKAAAFAERYGAGSTASRLICGTYGCFDDVERKVALLKGAESAMILNSGFQTNVSLLPALTDPDSLILSDWLNHNSIIQGAVLSRCRRLRFRHNDYDHLRDLLFEHRNKGWSRIVIVSESIFSMDGDTSDIDRLVALSEEFQAILVVDEAHATGVIGERGMGLSCGKGVDIVMGTFGKACGSFGAYIACSETVRDYLVNCCSGFIYTTAMPPPVVGSIDAALDLIPQMEREREDLFLKGGFLRQSLRAMGFDTGKSTTQIVPVIVGDDRETLNLSAWLEKNGFLAIAIRPPTVPRGEARIRLALSAAHTWEQIEHLVEAFQSWSEHGAYRVPPAIVYNRD